MGCLSGTAAIIPCKLHGIAAVLCIQYSWMYDATTPYDGILLPIDDLKSLISY